MRRRRPYGGADYVPLPAVPRGLTQREWYAHMRAEWADQFEEFGERWAVARTVLAECEAFNYSGAVTAAKIKALDEGWKAGAA